MLKENKKRVKMLTEKRAKMKMNANAHLMQL